MKKKYLGIVLPLTFITTQPTLASSSYSASSILKYTLTVSNQNSSSNELGNLIINSHSYITPQTESTSSHASISEQPVSLIDLNIPHTISFNAQDSINSGSNISEYYHNLDLSFENRASDTNDIFDISIDYQYTLSVKANGQAANITLSSDIYDPNENWSNGISVSVQNDISPNFENSNFSDTISFTLAAGETQTWYFESFSEANLEMTNVPLPAAFWLFGTAVLGLISRQSTKKTLQ